jgi:hypothetical protein
MTSTGSPDFSSFDNAILVQVYENGSTLKTSCYINVTQQPPLVSDFTPVDDEMFAGKETDRYILYNGVEYRTYQVQGSKVSVKEG